MNIFNIAILAFMLNTSFLECGTIPIKHQYKTRNPQKLTKNAKTSDLSKHMSKKKSSGAKYMSKKKSSGESLGQDFPCKTLICLVQNYEVMKTSNGVLLKKSPSKSNSAKCTDLTCWLNLFNIQKTSYGFELTEKAVSKIQRPTRKHNLKTSPKFLCHTAMCLVQRYKVNDKSTKVISKTAKTITTTTKSTTIVTTPFPPIDEEYIEDVDQMFEDYFY